MVAKLKIYGLGLTETDKKTTSRVHHEMLTGSVNAGHWQKTKIDRQDLAGINSVVNEARVYFRKMTRPFGDDTSRLIPSTLVFEYMKQMGELRRRYEAERDKLIENWDAIVERQKMRLGPEFNPASYPPKENLERCFRFIPKMMPVPDWANIHDKDHVIFKIEKAMAKDIIEKAREDERRVLAESTADLWVRLMKTVDRMRAVCVDGGHVHKRMVDRIDEETRIVEHLNFMNDQELAAIIADIRDKLCGWTVKQIRKSPDLKAQLGRSAEVIIERIREKMEHGFIAMAA
jgi:hypothetical protein